MLTAKDGHEFSIYEAGPEGATSGLVVLQEIFGVNPHIRGVCDGFADAGYRVVAPALFDRIHRGMELEYGEEGFKVGDGLRQLIPLEYTLMDIAACVDHLAPEGPVGGPAVGVIGYCWGGTLAWVSAQRFDIAAAVGYYGGGITDQLDGDLYCPVLLHFGEEDGGIPATDVAAIRAAHASVEVHTYAGAGHGFNRDAEAAHTKLALTLTLGFLGIHLRGGATGSP